LTHTEAGKKGGEATVAHFGIELCPHCGQPVLSSHFKDVGRMGGLTTALKHKRDPEFYRRIGKMGGRGNKKQDRRGL